MAERQAERRHQWNGQIRLPMLQPHDLQLRQPRQERRVDRCCGSPVMGPSQASMYVYRAGDECCPSRSPKPMSTRSGVSAINCHWK